MHDAAAQIELLAAGLCIEKIKSCLGAHWQPRCLELQSVRLPAVLQAEFPETRIVAHRPLLKVWVSLEELGRIIPSSTTAAESDELDRVPGDLRGSLQAALISAFSDAVEVPVTLELAAEMAPVSSRSLQRHLHESGTTFRDLLGDALVVSASRYLQDPTTPVTEVAAIHGYSNPSHFIRAFKHYSGVSPGYYQKLAAQAST